MIYKLYLPKQQKQETDKEYKGGTKRKGGKKKKKKKAQKELGMKYEGGREGRLNVSLSKKE